MKTNTLDRQPTFGVHGSPYPPDLLTASNPADTTLVPLNDMAPKPSPQDQTFQSCFNSAIHPVIPSSNNPPMAKKPRNGKIARLPKPARDLVNRMLFNHVSQENIVEALDEIGFKVTQRNVSNWKTHGGYREWCLAQDYAIQLHNHQDNLIETVRRYDGSELPEVGLQVAATQLSQFFLTPHAAKLLASDPRDYERRVSMLNRISAQLKALQKYRDDCARRLGPEHDPARIRCDTNGEMERLRHDWSSGIGHNPKDKPIPHRNELLHRDQLFHVVPPDPPRLFPTFEEWKEHRKRDNEAAAKAQAQSTPPAVPTPAAPSGTPASDAPTVSHDQPGLPDAEVGIPHGVLDPVRV